MSRFQISTFTSATRPVTLRSVSRTVTFAVAMAASFAACSPGTAELAAGDASIAANGSVRLSAPSVPRNVIVLISDGCGPASFTMARTVASRMGIRDELYLDDVLVGSVRTSSANREVTDSAAGATAFACGVKTNHQAVGVDAAGNPAKTVLERAEELGMATGVIATKSITDATPAAFTAHVANRYEGEAQIAIQQISGGFDLLFGGGRTSFLPADAGGNRKDGRNLVDEARASGYNVVFDKPEWDAVTELPVIALLAEKHLAYEIDRDPSRQPTFPDIVRKAIDLLDDDPDGFFLMAEGSLIDIAGHANDAPAHVRDILAYDEGVRVALDYARTNGNTLVISVSDHETGGLTLGRNYRWNPEVLAQVSASQDSVAAALARGGTVRSVIEKNFGFADLTDDEVGEVEAASTGNAMNGALSRIVGNRALIDWTSFGHTGVDVNLYAFGPGSERFRGDHDNTFVGIQLFELLDAR